MPEHKNQCDGECHFQEPYGFVPHAGCPLHDSMTEDERKQYTKDRYVPTEECKCEFTADMGDGTIRCNDCKTMKVKTVKAIPTTNQEVNALLDIENLSSRFHQVYQEEMVRQGKQSKHKDFYHELPEDIKDLDRALARYVINFVVPNCVSEAVKKERESSNEQLKQILNRCKTERGLGIAIANFIRNRDNKHE